MRIRTKLTLLLIVFSLGPLLLAGLLDARATQRLGDDLSTRTAATLTRRAEAQLELITARMAERASDRAAQLELAASMIAAALDEQPRGQPRPAGGIVPGLIEPPDWTPADPARERAQLGRAVSIASAFREQPGFAATDVLCMLETGLAVRVPPRVSDVTPAWDEIAAAPSITIDSSGGAHAMVLTYRSERGNAIVRISLPVASAVPLTPLPPSLALDATAQLAVFSAGDEGAEVAARVLLHADAAAADPRWRDDDPGGADLLGFVRDPLLERRTFTSAATPRDLNAVVVAGPMLDFGERGVLALILSVPRDVLTADAARVTEDVRLRTGQQTMRTLVTALMVFLIAVLAAYFAARTVTRRIKRLEAVTGRVAEGDLSARAHAKGRDEVARLARNFNDMLPRVEEGLRLRQSAELAGELERRAMPTGDATVRGFDVHAEARYCQQVGGDCIDHFSGPDSDIVIVADIAGTGVSAALVTHAVRAVLRAGAETGRDAADLMTELNAAVRRESARENVTRFIKLFYLEVERETGRVRWCSAGHDAAYMYAPERDEFTPLTSQAPPLGVEDEPEFTVEQLDPPAAGTVFYFGTDGVWAAQNPAGDPIGRDRILEIIRQHAHEPARRTAEAVIDAVESHRDGSVAHDDLAFVVLRAGGG